MPFASSLMHPPASIWPRKSEASSTPCFFALIFLLMLALNHYELRWIDDYCRTATGSFLTIVQTTWHEYFSWTGRFFATFLTRIFLNSRPPNDFTVNLFDIANSAVFCAYIYFIFVFARGRRPSQFQDLPVLILILALAICSTDAPSLSIFWKTGAINYLWAVTGEVFVLTQFLESVDRGLEDSHSGLFKALFPLFCFLIATFSENISVTVSVVLPCLLGYATMSSRRRAPTYLGIAALAHLAGCIVLLIAPGNFARLGGSVREPKPYLVRLVGDLSHLASTLGLHGWLVVAIVCGILYQRRQRGKEEERPEFLRMATAISTALLSFLVMTAAPSVYGGRTAFATESFMICALAVLFSRRKISTGRDWLISSLCVCFALWPLGIKLNESIQLTQQRDAREELIARAKAAGGTEVVLPPFFIRGVGYDKTRVRRWNMVEIGDINVDWSNKCFADTYELSKSSRADIPK